MRTCLGAAAVTALLLLAGCGNDPSPGADRAARSHPVATPTAMPTAIPSADGEVRGFATVIDEGKGAELCIGGVLDSMPPQCGGPRLIGWDWSQHAGEFDETNGIRWGEFGVTGTFDGKDITPSSVVPADEWTPDPDATGYEPTWDTPCAEPDGGWAPVDDATTTDEALRQAEGLAKRLPDFGQLWVDQVTDDGTAEDVGSEAANTILDVAVTEDLDGAEAALRAVWGGPLCVSEVPLTHDQIRAVGGRMCDLPGVLTCSGDEYPIYTEVMFDDGSIQAWADGKYGEGTVVVDSALQAVD